MRTASAFIVVCGFLLVLDCGCRKPAQASNVPGAGQGQESKTMFSMRIDDVFVMKPGGVVVVGVANSGLVRPGDKLEVTGSNKRLSVSVKGLETFDQEKKQFIPLNEAAQGQRVGIWILGAEKNQISPGDTIEAGT